jgi:rhodanese-related sulfurtransferase
MVLHPDPVEIGSVAMKHSPAFLELVNAAKRNIRETTVPVVAERLQKGETFHLVDTREDDEWRAGHIRGAIHLGKGVIERDIEAKIPNKDDEIILYCGGGFRSALAAEALQKMGYTHVVSMDGGIRGWRAAGLPEDK